NMGNLLSQRLGYAVHAGEPYAAVFPHEIIPQAAFSPAAQGTLQFIPTPNKGENIHASAAESTRTTDDMAGQRVDFLNKKTGNWSVYYYFDNSTYLDPKGGGSFPGFATTSTGMRQQATISNTRILGPTAVNELRWNFTRIPSISAPESGALRLESMGYDTGEGTLANNNSGPTDYTGGPSIELNNFGFAS